MQYLLIGVLAIIAAVGLIKPDKIPKWLTATIICLIIFSVILQINIEKRNTKENEISRYAGVLEKETKIILSSKENKYPKLEIGDSGSVFLWAGPEETPMFKIFDDNSITIWLENERLKISTIMRNKEGKVIAELVANEWKVNKNKAFDRNFTNDALEVKDEDGDIVLQVRLRDDRIQFQGKFYDKNGNGVAFGKSSDPRQSGGIIEKTGSDRPNLQLKIRPIFKYPSELHLGELL